MRIDSKIIVPLLKLLLRPIVLFCMRYSLRIQDLLEVSKLLFIEIAQDKLAQDKIKITDASLSIMTGLHRRDVTRLKGGLVTLDKAHDVISKIIGQWQSDKRFSKGEGQSAPLSFGSEQSEFSKLVYSVSNDITPASVLGELERIGAVKRGKDKLSLMQDTYVPKGNPINGFRILSDDCNNLIQTVEQNVLGGKKPPNMHYSTVYDRIDPDAIPQIQLWLLEKGKELHLSARQFLSQFDLDINPKGANQDKANRVVISSFSLISEKELE